MATINTAIELQDGFTNVFYQVISSVNLGLAAMEDLNRSMSAPVDMASIEAARDSINQATIAVQEMDEAMQKVEAPSIKTPDTQVNWQSDSFEVFANSGVERFQQEVQSVNNMFSTLNKTQQQIAETAAQTDLFPASAVADMNNMQNRLQLIQQQIQTIENNPLNIGMDSANMKMEQLRGQFVQAVQEQENLNRAVENMDVQAANEAYLRLSQTVSGTERYIRDNVNEQGLFNQEIQEGTQRANGLADTIKNAALAYVSIQSVGKVLNISDELVQTTSRLDMMNDGLQSTQELVNMVYAAAQDARGSFSEMADVVARFGNNAGDAFSSSEEVVAFADLIQKQMTIAGASTQESSNAMLQLSQALGSGVLRGDELNSIFEQSPNIIQSIADYLDVPIGQIREMAEEGELSADVVKAAIFASADEINAKFEEMPMTWGQIWQSMKNTALIEFQPVLQRLNDMANSEAFQTFVNGAIGAMGTLANVVLNIFDLVATVGGFIADNWSIISPIIYGVIGALAVYAAYLGIVKGIELATAAASAVMAVGKGLVAAATMIATGATWAQTTAQLGLNGAMYACPIVWIIFLIIALVAVFYAAIAAVNHFAGTSISATGAIAGVFASWVAFVINRFIMIYNYIASLAEFFMNVWAHPVYSTKRLFVNLADLILDFCISATEGFDEVATNLANAFIEGANLAIEGINWIIDALNQIPGIDIGNIGEINKTASITSSLRDVKNDLHDWLGPEPADYYSATKLDYISIGDAWDAGYSFGEAAEDKISNLFGGLFDENGSNLMESVISGANAGAGIGAGLGPDTASVMEDIGSNIDDIAGNTGAIRDSIDITEEDLRYLRDIAEQESINRFTTAEIIIEQTNHNTVSGKMDLDGIVSGLTDAANEAVDIIAEGVHV